MSPINYEALRSGDLSAQLPADGSHQARLERAALVETTSGERLVTEWAEADGEAQWTSWNRFDETGLTYTIELLDGLGIDRAGLADDATFGDELEKLVGHVYNVRTTSQLGSRGDRTFVSTYVDGRALGVQQDLDMPADTSGLPPSGGSPAAKVKDEDEKIPF